MDNDSKCMWFIWWYYTYIDIIYNAYYISKSIVYMNGAKQYYVYDQITCLVSKYPSSIKQVAIAVLDLKIIYKLIKIS